MADTQSNNASIFHDDVDPTAPRIAPCSARKEDAFPPPVRQVSFDEEADVVPRDGSSMVKEPATSDDAPVVSRAHRGLSFELCSFWFSCSAVKLFHPKHGETPEEAVDGILELLETALEDEAFEGDFGKILHGGKDALQFLSVADLDKISVRAKHVYTALTFAKEAINNFERFVFRDCCERAIACLAYSVPREERPSGITVMRWFRQFKRTRTFELPPGKKELVAIRGAISTYFSINPEMHSIFLHHMTRYLRTGIADTLASSTAYKYFKETLLPIGAKEEGYTQDCFYLFLANHKLARLDQRTFEAWFRDVLTDHRPTTFMSF